MPSTGPLQTDELRRIDAWWRHRAYTREHGDDAPDVRDWTWPGAGRP